MNKSAETFIYNCNNDIIIGEDENTDLIIDKILNKTENQELYRGIGKSFSPEFISRCMYSGFYVTSTLLNNETFWYDFMLGKLDFFPLLNFWHVQTVLFFDNLHISKTIYRNMKKYEFRVNYDFKNVIEKTVNCHGIFTWITPPLEKTLIELNKQNYDVKAFSFEVYRDGELKAGEIGIITGKIYTSYSGFHNESCAGSVQLAMMLNYLKNNNFDFCNFGTDDSEKNNLYKQKFGATYISREDFIKLWRAGRSKKNDC